MKSRFGTLASPGFLASWVGAAALQNGASGTSPLMKTCTTQCRAGTGSVPLAQHDHLEHMLEAPRHCRLRRPVRDAHQGRHHAEHAPADAVSHREDDGGDRVTPKRPYHDRGAASYATVTAAERTRGGGAPTPASGAVSSTGEEALPGGAASGPAG